MTSVVGTDGLTYYNTSSSINITNNSYTNSTNYYGSNNISVFNVSNSNTISSIINSGIILGGGGSNGNSGKDGLNNSGSITVLKNTGAFLGGGGSGTYGGSGGAGGGGGSTGAKGGSIVTALGGQTYTQGGGGGGPGGNGGSNINNSLTPGGGGTKFGPFGGGGFGAYNPSISYICNASSFQGGNGGNGTSAGGGSGGGGYGGGNGSSGYSNRSSGGGGGGGLAGDINSGSGGYGINNSGNIQTLINSQGGLISNTDSNNYYYGPLFYCGNAPTNYNILINSTTQYGQLWCTGVTNTTGSITFGIEDGSTLTTGTYASVLKFNSGTVTLNNTSGTYQKSRWTLVQNGLYYDLNVIYVPTYPCFKIGSKILTDKGYQLIENLRNGDLVKTLKNGYLPIVLIGKSDIYNSGNKERIKNRLYNLSCYKYNDLIEDLVLTGCHSILVDTLMDYQIIEMGGEERNLYITDDKLRLFCYLDPLSDPYDKEGTFTIYHIALENENYYGNYGIYANGLLVESCSIRYLKELSNMNLIE